VSKNFALFAYEPWSIKGGFGDYVGSFDTAQEAASAVDPTTCVYAHIVRLTPTPEIVWHGRMDLKGPTWRPHSELIEDYRPGPLTKPE